MAYYSQNGTGIDSNAYIYVQLQVTRTDYDTYSRFDLKSVAVSDTGSSGFIRGQVTTNQGGTSWTASTGWKDVYYNGSTTLATSSFNINRGSSDKTVRCGAYAEGGGSGIYAGGTDYAWLNVTVPKAESPNAPSNCSASYVSDSSASVSWANGSTTTVRPRTATLVERQTDGGSWVQVATLGSSVTNWTDNGISANHRYQYRVRAQNTGGYSSYATSGYIYTTPAAPTAVSLDKTAATTISASATVDAPYATGYDVQRSTDSGATWSADIATNAALPVADTVTGTVRYRVRSNLSNSLYSAWKQSSDVTTIVPPDAPTITQSPANPSVLGSTATIKWTPNHPDGTSQSAAQVKVAYPNGTSTTFGVTTATSWTSSALTANGTYSVQVRTKGLDPDWGAWSSTVSWGVYEAPSVVITSPATDGTDVIAMPLTVSWDVSDATGVATQSLKVMDSTRTMWSGTVPSGTTSKALTIADLPLVNGNAYSIVLDVRGGSGLSTAVTRTFDVAFVPPEEPAIDVSADGGSVSISVNFVSGTVETESITVLRENADGTTWAVAENLQDGGNCIDPLPPLGGDVVYVAVAQAASGATAQSTASVSMGTTAWILNFGNAAEQSMEILYGRSNSRELEHGGAPYHFADGGAGGGLPVFYSTTDRDQKGTLKFALIYHDDADRLFALSDANPVGWIRDSNGRRWRAKIAFRESYVRGPIFQMTADWQAVRWREAW